MATQVLSPGDTTDYASGVIAVTDNTELNETFETDQDAVVRDLKYEFAASVVYVIKIRGTASGPDVVLRSATAGAAGDTGAVGAGRTLPQGGRILVTTSGGITGAKKVELDLSPCQVGV